MRKLAVIVLALLLAPLVGTVALSDFNYIGQGGGGLSESDVQTLVASSVEAAFAPIYAPSVGCEEGGEEPNCIGGMGYIAQVPIVGLWLGTTAVWAPPNGFVTSMPWDAVLDGESAWRYFVCIDGRTSSGGGFPDDCFNAGQVEDDGIYGIDGPNTTEGATPTTMNQIPIPFTCDDLGLLGFLVVGFDISGGNTVLGPTGFIAVNDDYGACVP